MHVQIQHKDGTVEVREVEDADAAQALANEGLTVLAPRIDGGHQLLEASGPVPAKKAAKKAAKK